MKWFEVFNKSKDVAELYIYGNIVHSKWLPDDVSASDIAAELKKIGNAKILNGFINSGGGSVFAGEAIFSMINRLDIEKVAYIDGLAASISSVIPCAFDKVVIPANAAMMIHNPSTCVCGQAEDLIKASEVLVKLKSMMIATYAEKTSLSEEKISKMMNEETWMDGKEAVELGFADELEEAKKIAACYDPSAEKATMNSIIHDLKGFNKEKYKKVIKNSQNLSPKQPNQYIQNELTLMEATILT